MLYNVVVNDWDETTYVPTTLGNVLLVVVILALLAGAVLFARKVAARQRVLADPSSAKPAAKLLGGRLFYIPESSFQAAMKPPNS